MKKRLILLSAALLFGLTACGRSAAEESPSPVPLTPAPTAAMATAAVTPVVTTPAAESALPTPAAAETAAPAPVATPAPSPTPTAPPEPSLEPVPAERPSDEEVLAAYQDAAEAYSWFDRKTLSVDESRPETVGETVCYPVSDERFPTLDSLRLYLKGLFSDEIVDALLPLDGLRYFDRGGALYAVELDRGSDIARGGVTCSVVWPEEEPLARCTVRVEVELLDENDLTKVIGKRVYEFPYQKVGEKWAFTQFASIF